MIFHYDWKDVRICIFKSHIFLLGDLFQSRSTLQWMKQKVTDFIVPHIFARAFLWWRDGVFFPREQWKITWLFKVFRGYTTQLYMWRLKPVEMDDFQDTTMRQEAKDLILMMWLLVTQPGQVSHTRKPRKICSFLKWAWVGMVTPCGKNPLIYIGLAIIGGFFGLLPSSVARKSSNFKRQQGDTLGREWLPPLEAR